MDARRLIGATANFSVPVLAAGTTTTISTTNAINYAIKGRAYTKAALTNAATPTTDFLTGAAFVGVLGGGSVTGANGYGSIFIFGEDSGGTLRCVQGSVVALDSSGAFAPGVLPQLPELPDTMCPFGFVLIKAGNTASATTAWKVGASNMASVTGITYTFGDIAFGMPDRPFSA